MAWSWLDAARYADSDGYESDPLRNMWPWRDWVAKVFNESMPFDQFIVEQLAGDELSEPSLLQRLATGFNRNHRLNNEGGIEPEEWRIEYVADRAETTATVFLGLTWGCARCHDHKYDPITKADYYRLFAYFNQLEEIGNGRGSNNAPPMIDMPELSHVEEFARVSAQTGTAGEAFFGRCGEDAGIQGGAQRVVRGAGRARRTRNCGSASARKRSRSGPRREKNKARRHFLENVYPGAAEIRRAYAAAQASAGPVGAHGLESDGDARRVEDRGTPSCPQPRRVESAGRQGVTARHAWLSAGRLRDEYPRNRLGLARWLVSSDNPLTARVIVNREWERFFGVGLVKTQEDFGAQGAPPSHPDLLDHLASPFRGDVAGT